MIPIQNIRTKEDNENKIIHIQADISLEELSIENYNINRVKECLAKYKHGNILLGVEDFANQTIIENEDNILKGE